MTARAHTRFNLAAGGVDLAVTFGEREHRQVACWDGQYIVRSLEEPSSVDDPAHWLTMPEDMARAMYEALADYFGHSGNDTRALRRDYDSERKRVDDLIAAVIRRA